MGETLFLIECVWMLFNSLVEELSLFYVSVIWILPFDISVFFIVISQINPCFEGFRHSQGHKRRIHAALRSL